MDLTHPLLARQHFVYASRQASMLGIRRLESGVYPGWRILPGVWSLLPPPLTVEATRSAALLYAGEGGRLSGTTSAAIRGWYVSLVPRAVVAVVPASRQPQSQAFIRIRRSRVPGEQEICGWLLTTGPHTLVDCALELSTDELAGVVATAVQRREVRLDDIRRFMEHHPRIPGAMAVKGVVQLLAPGAESRPEAECLRAFASWGFPVPRCQVEIYDESGILICIADFWWDGVAGFYDGGTHLSRKSQERDGAARSKLAALRIQVVVITALRLADPTMLRRRCTVAFETAARRVRPDQWRLGRPATASRD